MGSNPSNRHSLLVYDVELVPSWVHSFSKAFHSKTRLGLHSSLQRFERLRGERVPCARRGELKWYSRPTNPRSERRMPESLPCRAAYALLMCALYWAYSSVSAPLLKDTSRTSPQQSRARPCATATASGQHPSQRSKAVMRLWLWPAGGPRATTSASARLRTSRHSSLALRLLVLVRPMCRLAGSAPSSCACCHRSVDVWGRLCGRCPPTGGMRPSVRCRSSQSGAAQR